MAASLFIKFTNLPFWIGTPVLVSFAVILYGLNIVLIRHYIKKPSEPGLLEVDAVLPPPEKGQNYFWEMTGRNRHCPEVGFVGWDGCSRMYSWRLRLASRLVMGLATQPELPVSSAHLSDLESRAGLEPDKMRSYSRATFLTQNY